MPTLSINYRPTLDKGISSDPCMLFIIELFAFLFVLCALTLNFVLNTTIKFLTPLPGHIL